MKKILFSFIGLLVISSMMGLVSSALVGQPPEITIQDISYEDRFGNSIEKPFYLWEKIYIEALIEDNQGWNDLKTVDLSFGGHTQSCWRDNIISNKTAGYKCSMSLLSSWHGNYDVSLVAKDKQGLEDSELIGNFWFNPLVSLSYDEVIFSPLDMGEFSKTDWITVQVSSEANENPVEVFVKGKNLYPEKGQCKEEKICSRTEKLCEREIISTRTRTKGICEKVPYNKTRYTRVKEYYNKTYYRRVCERIEGERVCEMVPYKTRQRYKYVKVPYNKTYYKRVCERISYEVPVYKRVCRETGECLRWKTVRTNCEFTGGNCGGSNRLSLDTFEYKIQGGDWTQLPSHNEVIWNGTGTSSFEMKFRSDIPDSCYGNYILDGRNIFIGLN